MAGCCSVLGAFLFEYDTPRIVLIRSRKVGLMNRAVQLFILAYVIGPAFLKAAENFTLLVKNNIWYPKFNFTKRNILPNITTTYLKSCIYNAATDPFCPIFRLGKIVENSGHSFQDMAVEGGIMGIQIKWDCNLDRAASFCLPRYSFRRLDTRDLDHNVSPGYNFRFAKYYNDLTGTERRTLIKAYGIRFDIIVFGKAGKFDIIPTMINIGSGLALFGVATVLCDVIVLYCMKKRYYYREKKYKYVEEYEQVDHPPNLSHLPPAPVVTTLSAGPDTPGSPTPPVSPAPALEHLP
uniref:Purinergic receptor P2X 4 n=1 Tax=Myotis myotis TaxID=51298 RepID=A0A7J7S2C0_MYOMY|nr:purinergic receptor P2X 4 [Myotis myotis]